MKEFNIWLRYTNNSFQQVLSQRATVGIFLTGKILRILLFLLFLSFLFRGANNLAGYSRAQIIFFYLSFNLIDSLGQLFFREVYRFRQMVVSGSLDLVLVKPLNPLVRILLGGADVLDLIVLFLIGSLTIWYGYSYISTSLSSWLFYALLIINGLVISAAFHIFVLGLGIISTSVDHLVMIYRDFTNMLRIPVDLYAEPIRFLLTFALPLGIMITFPAKALMSLLPTYLILISLSLSLISLSLSLIFWHRSLRHYQSASS